MMFLTYVGISAIIFIWFIQMWIFHLDMIKKKFICMWLKGFAQIHILSCPFQSKVNMHFSGKNKNEKD